MSIKCVQIYLNSFDCFSSYGLEQFGYEEEFLDPIGRELDGARATVVWIFDLAN